MIYGWKTVCRFCFGAGQSDKKGGQVRILNFILVSYPDREIYQKDIEEELNIRSASVSTLLKKMEAQDFIRREKVSSDDRLKKILPARHTVEMKEQDRFLTLCLELLR